jgi:hypothetical protein
MGTTRFRTSMIVGVTCLLALTLSTSAGAQEGNYIIVCNQMTRYKISYQIDGRSLLLGPRESRWHAVRPRGSLFQAIGAKRVDDPSRQPPTGGGFQQALLPGHRYDLQVLDVPSPIIGQERLKVISVDRGRLRHARVMTIPQP